MSLNRPDRWIATGPATSEAEKARELLAIAAARKLASSLARSFLLTLVELPTEALLGLIQGALVRQGST